MKDFQDLFPAFKSQDEIQIEYIHIQVNMLIFLTKFYKKVLK